MQIRKAERRMVKLKLKVSGPSGSGKTMGALKLGKGLVGDWSKIVLIDSENGSGELYSHLGESGSDRICALDFQESPTQYVPRHHTNIILEELLDSSEKVEKGIPLSKDLDIALLHGTSIGGRKRNQVCG